MATGVLEPSVMGKSRGRPRGDRDDVPIKIDRKLASMAKAIATARGITPGEYLSGIASAPIYRDYAKTLKEAEEKGARS
jgi:hypothetical protein